MIKSMLDKIEWSRIFRAWPWLAIGIAMMILISLFAAQQIGVLIWSLGKLSLAAFIGYWIAVSMERGKHPDSLPSGPERDNMLQRRAYIVSATIISMGFMV